MKKNNQANYIRIKYETFKSCKNAYPYYDLSDEEEIHCINEITNKLKLLFEKMISEFRLKIFLLREKRAGNINDLLNKKFLFYHTRNGVIEEYFLLTGCKYDGADYISKQKQKALSEKEIIFSNDHDGLSVVFEFPINSPYYNFVIEYLGNEGIQFESWKE